MKNGNIGYFDDTDDNESGALKINVIMTTVTMNMMMMVTMPMTMVLLP